AGGDSGYVPSTSNGSQAPTGPRLPSPPNEGSPQYNWFKAESNSTNPGVGGSDAMQAQAAFGLKGTSFAVSRAYFAISLLNVSRSVPSAGTAHASQTARTKKPRAILSMVKSPLDRCRRSRSERHHV